MIPMNRRHWIEIIWIAVLAGVLAGCELIKDRDVHRVQWNIRMTQAPQKITDIASLTLNVDREGIDVTTVTFSSPVSKEFTLYLPSGDGFRFRADAYSSSGTRVYSGVAFSAVPPPDGEIVLDMLEPGSGVFFDTVGEVSESSDIERLEIYDAPEALTFRFVFEHRVRWLSEDVIGVCIILLDLDSNPATGVTAGEVKINNTFLSDTEISDFDGADVAIGVFVSGVSSYGVVYDLVGGKEIGEFIPESLEHDIRFRVWRSDLGYNEGNFRFAGTCAAYELSGHKIAEDRIPDSGDFQRGNVVAPLPGAGWAIAAFVPRRIAGAFGPGPEHARRVPLPNMKGLYVDPSTGFVYIAGGETTGYVKGIDVQAGTAWNVVNVPLSYNPVFDGNSFVPGDGPGFLNFPLAGVNDVIRFSGGRVFVSTVSGVVMMYDPVVGKWGKVYGAFPKELSPYAPGPAPMVLYYDEVSRTLFISDFGLYDIVAVEFSPDFSSSTSTVVAGGADTSSNPLYSGPATAVQLLWLGEIIPLRDASGSLTGIIVSDTWNSIIRKIEFADPVTQIMPLAGSGAYGAPTSGACGTDLTFMSPEGLVAEYDTAGKLVRLYVADSGANQIVVLDGATMCAVDIFGTGNSSIFAGTEGVDVHDISWAPEALAFDPTTRILFVADNTNGKLFGVDLSTYPPSATVFIVAGSAVSDLRSGGDGYSALEAYIDTPSSALELNDVYYVLEGRSWGTMRVVYPEEGTVNSLMGDYSRYYLVAVTDVYYFDEITGVGAVGSNPFNDVITGGIFADILFADPDNGVIRGVDLSSRKVYSVVGSVSGAASPAPGVDASTVYFPNLGPVEIDPGGKRIFFLAGIPSYENPLTGLIFETDSSGTLNHIGGAIGAPVFPDTVTYSGPATGASLVLDLYDYLPVTALKYDERYNVLYFGEFISYSPLGITYTAIKAIDLSTGELFTIAGNGVMSVKAQGNGNSTITAGIKMAQSPLVKNTPLEGEDALASPLGLITDIEIGPDGLLYFVNVEFHLSPCGTYYLTGGSSIWLIDNQGRLKRVAGTGENALRFTGVKAYNAAFPLVTDIYFTGPENLMILESLSGLILQLGP